MMRLKLPVEALGVDDAPGQAAAGAAESRVRGGDLEAHLPRAVHHLVHDLRARG